MRIDLPETKRLTHELVIPIRWGDMDAMGHVNNAVYFRYLETARVAWLEKEGFAVDPRGTGPVIINAFCNFLRQLEYPGEVLARHYVGEVGRSSFDTYVLLSRTDDADTLYAAGGATVVWTDFPKQKSVPLPERVRAVLGA